MSEEENESGASVPSRRLIVGLSGFAGVGKDAVRNHLCETRGFVGAAFADRLRLLARHLDPFFVEAGERYSALIDRLGYDVAKVQFPEVRRFLVQLGDGVRVCVGRDAWLDALLCPENLDRYPTNASLVISDVRYPNEANRIFQLGGHVVRIVRPGIAPANPTEADSVSRTPYDYRITNDGTLDDLRAEIDAVFSEIRSADIGSNVGREFKFTTAFDGRSVRSLATRPDGYADPYCDFLQNWYPEEKDEGNEG